MPYCENHGHHSEPECIECQQFSLDIAICHLGAALDFLDACHKEPNTASYASCWKDAREWIEKEAREVVKYYNLRGHQ